MITGKALLIIEKTDTDEYYTDVHVQSSSHKDKWISLEDLSYISDTELPEAAYKLKNIGDKVWVKVKYKICYHVDYYGEADVDIYFTKEKIIRKRKWKKSDEQYQSKKPYIPTYQPRYGYPWPPAQEVTYTSPLAYYYDD